MTLRRAWRRVNSPYWRREHDKYYKYGGDPDGVRHLYHQDRKGLAYWRPLKYATAVWYNPAAGNKKRIKRQGDTRTLHIVRRGVAREWYMPYSMRTVTLCGLYVHSYHKGEVEADGPRLCRLCLKADAAPEQQLLKKLSRTKEIR